MSADDDDDEGGIFGEDGAKGLGNVSIFFLVIGSSYIVLRRSLVYSKKYLNAEKYNSLRDGIANFYMKFKRPILTIHNITMIIATVVAIIHGIYLEHDFQAIGLTGWTAAISMILLSTSGIIIWAKFRPIWDYKTTRTHLRFIHRQWLFSGIMVIALVLHLSIGED